MKGQWRLMAVLTLVGPVVLACGGDGGSGLPGSVTADGSSTVYPITEAMAEEFSIAHGGGVNVTIAYSGTGGGFKRFCAGEIDIGNASRPITESERAACVAANIDFLEIPVAIDGLTIVANIDNAFAQCLTVGELRRIWEPNSTVRRWSDVRPEWPDTPIELYGAGTNSGTFDYFTEAIMGKTGAIRSDYTASEDDNVLVQGVEGDAAALGFFGYAYYAENAGRLRAVGVDNGNGCVTPTPETVRSGTYEPLSRPLFIYVRRASLEQPIVRAFVEFYLENAEALVPQVGYVPLPAADYGERLTAIRAGSGS